MIYFLFYMWVQSSSVDGSTTFKHSSANSRNNGSCIAARIAFQALGAVSISVKRFLRWGLHKRFFKCWLLPGNSKKYLIFAKLPRRMLLAWNQMVLPSICSFSLATVSSVLKGSWSVGSSSSTSMGDLMASVSFNLDKHSAEFLWSL